MSHSILARRAALLDELLHGCRGVFGLPVLSESPAWPAHDDPRVMGYLLPDEVKALDAVAGVLGDNPSAENVRAMVRRAATADLRLATLQSGL